MRVPPISRRVFLWSSAASVVSAATVRAQGRPLSVEAAVAAIQGAVAPWRAQTVDGLKAGDPATLVTGIGVAVMPTLDVLRAAVARRQNLVIVQEPLYYTADENVAARTADPVYLAKKRFIEEQGLAVWRFSDHWAARPGTTVAGPLAAVLGWTDRVPGTEAVYRVPVTTLAGLEQTIRERLGLRGGVRRVGEARFPVRTVGLSPGTTSLTAAAAQLAQADVVVAGEPREWEVVPYVLDSWSTGDPATRRGLIAIGRVVSEAPGAAACAAWLRGVLPMVAISALPAPNPYWSPSA